MILLFLSAGTPPVPAVVLTLFPAGKKPRPSVQKVQLSAIKSFRAIVMQKEQGENTVLVPTSHCWRYTPLNVLCILDVESSDLSLGKVTLTRESLDAWDRLRDEQMSLDELEPEKVGQKKRRVGKKGATASQKTVLAKARKHLHAAAKARAVRKRKTGQDDVILPDQFRRSAAGRQCIKRVVIRALELELMNFSSSPSFDSDSGSCALKGLSDYMYSEFISQVPMYFQFRFHKIRNGEQYGCAVCQVLEVVLKDLRSNPPSKKSLTVLIRDVHSAKLQGKISL